MAFTKSHALIRSNLATALVGMVTEKAGYATTVARSTALGTLSTGDGGATATGEMLVATKSLTELINAASGDADFAVAIALNSASATAVQKSAGTGAIVASGANFISASIFNLLPSPLVTLYRSGMSPLDVSNKATVSNVAYNSSVSVSAAQSNTATLTLDLASIAFTATTDPVTASDNRIVISNPLDAGSGSLSINYTVGFVA